MNLDRLIGIGSTRFVISRFDADATNSLER